MKKKLLCLFAAMAMVLALPACGKKDDTPPSSAQTSGDSDSQQSTQIIPGKMNILNTAEGGQPVIRGISLDGNRAGTYKENDESVNGRAPSSDNIRSVFELNEWITIIPDSDESGDLVAYIVKHQSDLTAYRDSYDSPFSGLTAGVPVVTLKKPEEEGGYGWGELAVNPELFTAGDYDLVITDKGTPVACVWLKLYDEEALSGKSDAELNQLMADERAAAESK